jgi:N utilization substance protein B
LAKKYTIQSNHPDHLLQDQLAQLPLLEELYKNSKWISSINQKGVSWAQEPDRLQAWYIRLMQSAEMPRKLIHPLNPENSIHFLEYIVQTIIFGDEQIGDFFSMLDLYWDEHKHVVQKMLTQTFRMLDTKNFDKFTLFWYKTEEKWERAAAFYNHLLQITLKSSNAYEAMIGQKAEKWDSERIILIDKLILKLALAEILGLQKIPIKVSINEYIEMAKLYGTSKSGQFINGILEGILKGLHIDIQQETRE